MIETMAIHMCVDCVMVVANGFEPGMDGVAYDAACKGIDEWAAEGYIVCVGDTDNDEAFSRSFCDVCGSKYAGQRLHGWAVPK